MEKEKISAIIESVLFASGDPVSISRLVSSLRLDKPLVVDILESLTQKFNKETSGICIVKMNNSYQMCTKPEHAVYVRKVMNFSRKLPLSSASMEVLTIIAYNQPVTKNYIEKLRGVDCNSLVNNLLNKDLIEEAGRLEVPGRPVLYKTTLNFLKCFGLDSLDELPLILPEKGTPVNKEKQVSFNELVETSRISN